MTKAMVERVQMCDTWRMRALMYVWHKRCVLQWLIRIIAHQYWHSIFDPLRRNKRKWFRLICYFSAIEQ